MKEKQEMINMEEFKNNGEYKVKKEDIQKMLFFLNKESNKTVKDDNNKHR